MKGSYWVGENNGVIRRDRAPYRDTMKTVFT